MADEGRWIATPKGKHISVKVDNMPEPQKPIPVVDNLPLEDYQDLQKELERVTDLATTYENLIDSLFGNVVILDNVKPYKTSIEHIDDVANGDVIFFVKYHVKNEEVGDILNGLENRNILPML